MKKCHHPKTRMVPTSRGTGPYPYEITLEEVLNWQVNRHGAVKCIECNRIIGRVTLNEFGMQTAMTKDAKRSRERFRVAPTRIEL